MLKKSIFENMLNGWTSDETVNPKWDYSTFTSYDILGSEMQSVAQNEQLYCCAYLADNNRFGYVVLAYDGESLRQISVVETPCLYDLHANIDILENAFQAVEIDWASATAVRARMTNAAGVSEEVVSLSDNQNQHCLYSFDQQKLIIL